MASQSHDDPAAVLKLQEACKDLKRILQASAAVDKNLEKMDDNLDRIDEALSAASRRVAPLQSLAMANKALDTRINRAITPALALLDSFRTFETLQDKILGLTSKLNNNNSNGDHPTIIGKRLKRLDKLVTCVEDLKEAIDSIVKEGEPAIQKLQEVVEFLSRTKATDQFRAHRLRETLVTLKALYETEVEEMRFEGLLDESLLNLQDEFETILQQLKHRNINEVIDNQGLAEISDLGTQEEIDVLRKISVTLAANDCLDICIDIYVKVRYRRAAKALMRLNPEYLRTYTPEEIDEMEWGSLETAIALWIEHFQLAVKVVFVSEKKLCGQVLGGLMEGEVWPECFVKIADKIMAVFFRFGEGVARSKKEPQKLFKLLDMFDSLEKLKPEFGLIFDGDAGSDICTRFRELEKLLVHAGSRVFWEFGLQIEGDSDGSLPPQDGSIPKLVRYAINYLKYLTTDNYIAPLTQVLRTEQMWRQGKLSEPESEQNLLRDSISSIMEALQRNIESKRSLYGDKILPYVFSMNTYWYIYMRTRNSELGKLLGDQYMKAQYKVVAEESAYMYQKHAWGSLVKLLLLETPEEAVKKPMGAVGKMEAFLKGFEEMSHKHKTCYVIAEADLRQQIKDATVKLVVTAYTEFINNNAYALEITSVATPDTIQGFICKIFDGTGDRQVKIRDSQERPNSRRSRSDLPIFFNL